MPKRARLWLAWYAMVAILAASCGGSGAPAPGGPAASPAAPAAETLDQRMARLYDAAKAEGMVAFYSSLNQGDAALILPKFEQRFPGVKIQHTRASSEVLVQRLVTEKKAGQNLFDVFETNNFEVKFVIDQGYTQKYEVASANDFPPQARDPQGSWIADRLNKNVPGFNTTKVPPGQIKTWKDLCDKRYEGHIAVEQGDVAVYTMLRGVLGEAEAKNILQCVAANKPTIRSGHTDMDNLLAAGDFWITFNSYASVIANLKNEKKAPVDFVKTDPILIDIQLMALADKPPHPNAARLLMEWLASPDGQQAIADGGREYTSTKAKPKYAELADWTKTYYNSPDNRKDFDKDAEVWRSTFKIP